MNSEQQRSAIAEACGWKFIPEYYHGEDQPPELTTVTPDGRHLCGCYPDYLNDLNAMHEAEKVLIDGKEQVYFEDLHGVAGNLTFYRATAAQRAEAFLKTLNLWKP
jgi:hypothetical protein